MLVDLGTIPCFQNNNSYTKPTTNEDLDNVPPHSPTNRIRYRINNRSDNEATFLDINTSLFTPSSKANTVLRWSKNVLIGISTLS